MLLMGYLLRNKILYRNGEINMCPNCGSKKLIPEAHNNYKCIECGYSSSCCEGGNCEYKR
jgi:ribosomal protein S27AE